MRTCLNIFKIYRNDNHPYYLAIQHPDGILELADKRWK